MMLAHINILCPDCVTDTMDLLDDLNALSDEETQDFEEENEEKSENSDVEMESTEIDKYLLDSIQKAHDIHSITKVYNSSLLQETLSVLNVFEKLKSLLESQKY